MRNYADDSATELEVLPYLFNNTYFFNKTPYYVNY